MVKCQNSKSCSILDVLRPLFKFICSPLWFCVELNSHYTHISPFLLTNQVFWHCVFCSGFIYVGVFCPPPSDHKSPFIIYTWAVFVIHSLFVLPFEVVGIQKLLKPKIKVQKMSHVIIGLFGMILSIWTMIGSVIIWNFGFYLRLCEVLFPVSITFMAYSYTMFCSSCTRLYVRLPAENKPFSGLKLYVVLLGLFHLVVGFAAFWVTRNWFLYVLLFTSSFVFCVDAYSCFFTDSYMLCEHRAFKWHMKAKIPIDGIVYQVVVREMYEKSKNKSVLDLPEGFQFEDELKVDEKWYTMPQIMNSFWL